MQQQTETNFKRSNPLAEIRLDPVHIVQDVHELVDLLIPPPKTGSDKYWTNEGAAWLRAVALHVITRTSQEERRRATLADISACLSPPHSSGNAVEVAVDFVQKILAAMQDFDHGNPTVNAIVRQAVAHMQGKAPYERAGVFGAAVSGLFH